MECCECNKKLSLLNVLKIVNPKKFKCSNCNEYISLNKKGIINYYIFTAITVLMFGIYIFFVKERIGSLQIRSLIFWGYLLPSSAAFYWFISKVKTVAYAKKHNESVKQAD